MPDELLQRLRRFHDLVFPGVQDQFLSLVHDGQHPSTLFIGCSDSRRLSASRACASTRLNSACASHSSVTAKGVPSCTAAAPKAGTRAMSSKRRMPPAERPSHRRAVLAHGALHVDREKPLPF